MRPNVEITQVCTSTYSINVVLVDMSTLSTNAEKSSHQQCKVGETFIHVTTSLLFNIHSSNVIMLRHVVFKHCFRNSPDKMGG